MQRKMLSAALDSFKFHYDDIMHGRLEHGLIDEPSVADINKALGLIQKKLLQYKAKDKKELAGWEVIHRLLDIFIKASEGDDFNTTSNTVSSHLYSIISVNFRQNYEQETYPNDRYNRIRMVIDFLTSLNDNDAISLYQELKGLKI